MDLGAVGKGYAGDLVTELLKKRGITSAVLDIGGNIQTIGTQPDGTSWKLGIRNLFGESTIGVLFVANKAVVTSGNYERYFVKNNQLSNTYTDIRDCFTKACQVYAIFPPP